MSTALGEGLARLRVGPGDPGADLHLSTPELLGADRLLLHPGQLPGQGGISLPGSLGLGGGLGAEDQGVLVTSLDEGPAANAGLYPDDIILQVNHQPVKSANQFVDLAKDLPRGKVAPLLVKRENESLYLAVRLPE